jgi:hypothetical protein
MRGKTSDQTRGKEEKPDQQGKNEKEEKIIEQKAKEKDKKPREKNLP